MAAESGKLGYRSPGVSGRDRSQYLYDAYAGRSPRGQRCVAPVPHGHWKITTFIAALRCDAVTAPMVIDGPMDGALFLAYVREFLCPMLRAGDIVIADNLSSHKGAGVREAIEAVGAAICYLPPYSPDLNLVEKLFSRLNAFSQEECKNYFISSGYANA